MLSNNSYVNNITSNTNYTLCKRSKTIAAMAILLVFIYCLILNSLYVNHKTNIKKFKMNLENRAYEEAEKHLDKCRKITPTLIYYSVLYKKRYLHTNNQDDIERSRFYLSEAIQTNPRDVRLKYNYAMTLFLLGEKQKAKAILKSLCEEFPRNSLMHASLGNMLYLDNNKKSAAFHFARAIELTPAILETDSWAQFMIRDEITRKMIYTIIERDMQNIENDPIQFAKFGKILYLRNDHDKAVMYLTEALTALPNLQSPWATLWKIKLKNGDVKAEEYLKKAKLLGFDENRMINKERSSVVFNDGPLPVDPELYGYRNLKFQLWYATKWYSEMMIF